LNVLLDFSGHQRQDFRLRVGGDVGLELNQQLIGREVGGQYAAFFERFHAEPPHGTTPTRRIARIMNSCLLPTPTNQASQKRIHT